MKEQQLCIIKLKKITFENLEKINLKEKKDIGRLGTI